MAHYLFRAAKSPQGFLSATRLSTRILNALEELRAAGHPIEVDQENLQEYEDQDGEFVRVAVRGVREPGFHYMPGVEEVFAKHAVAISVYGQSIND